MRQLELLVWAEGSRGRDPAVGQHFQDHQYHCSDCAWFSCVHLPDVGSRLLLQELQAVGAAKVLGSVWSSARRTETKSSIESWLRGNLHASPLCPGADRNCLQQPPRDPSWSDGTLLDRPSRLSDVIQAHSGALASEA